MPIHSAILKSVLPNKFNIDGHVSKCLEMLRQMSQTISVALTYCRGTVCPGSSYPNLYVYPGSSYPNLYSNSLYKLG